MTEVAGVECPHCEEITEIEVMPESDYSQGVEHICMECRESFLVYSDNDEDYET